VTKEKEKKGAKKTLKEKRLEKKQKRQKAAANQV
jgi:hypothetical protein